MGKLKHYVCLLCLLALVAGSFAGLGKPVQAAEALTGATATEVVEQMGLGWNLGNTFDATGGNDYDIFSQEQSWGNPIVTETLINAVAASGYRTIRIPITWNRNIYIEDGQYKVREEFLERIKTVVDYAYANDMFVIINAHHEEWINTTKLSNEYPRIGLKLRSLWSAVSDYFADYDQHLIFEAMNEPRLAGANNEWGGNTESYAAVNYLNQVFVSTVRGNGKGYNSERCLMVPGYAASSSANIMKAIALPTYEGKVCNNLIVSVHCYSPYNFCLSDEQMDFDPESPSDTADIRNIFRNIDNLFLSKGIPVVIGETGATNKDNTEARENWFGFMGKMAKSYGVPIVLWDNGSVGNSGGERHAFYNRRTGEEYYPTLFEQMFKGWNEAKWGESRGTGGSGGDGDSVETVLDGSPIWTNAEGYTSPEQWDATYIMLTTDPNWYAEGRDIMLLYSGSGEPKLMLDSEVKAQWWMPINPDSIETLGDKKVATFKYASIMAELAKYDVTSPAELRNTCVLATNANITTYEIVVTGESKPIVTYMANGGAYHTGSEPPEDPSFMHMVFEGWYTTPDYREGTELVVENLEADAVVYAKFSMNLDDIKVAVPTPTPLPTEKPKATPTEKPSEAPSDAPTKAPTPGEGEGEGGSGSGTDGDNSGAWLYAVVAAVAVVIIAVIAIVLRKKGEKPAEAIEETIEEAAEEASAEEASSEEVTDEATEE